MSHWKTGMKKELKKVFTQKELEAFAKLSLDDNPVHLDEEFAKNTPFGGTIAHGMLVASLFSALLGRHLPGAGTIYLGQNLKFTKPVYPGEEITACVEILNIREDKPIATLLTEARNPKGEIVITGEAVVRLPQN